MKGFAGDLTDRLADKIDDLETQAADLLRENATKANLLYQVNLILQSHKTVPQIQSIEDAARSLLRENAELRARLVRLQAGVYKSLSTSQCDCANCVELCELADEAPAVSLEAIRAEEHAHCLRLVEEFAGTNRTLLEAIRARGDGGETQ